MTMVSVVASIYIFLFFVFWPANFVFHSRKTWPTIENSFSLLVFNYFLWAWFFFPVAGICVRKTFIIHSTKIESLFFFSFIVWKKSNSLQHDLKIIIFAVVQRLERKLEKQYYFEGIKLPSVYAWSFSLGKFTIALLFFVQRKSVWNDISNVSQLSVVSSDFPWKFF